MFCVACKSPLSRLYKDLTTSDSQIKSTIINCELTSHRKELHLVQRSSPEHNESLSLIGSFFLITLTLRIGFMLSILTSSFHRLQLANSGFYIDNNNLDHTGTDALS